MFNMQKVLQLSLRHFSHKTHKYNRLFSSQNIHKENSNIEEYVPIYKFPYIKPICVINRLKWYQTLLTATTVPGSAVLNEMSYITLNDVGLITLIGLSGCMFLYSLGFITNNFIGHIYYNEENDFVKISYADFWGRRKNLELPRTDIIPQSELPATLRNRLYLTFRRFSTKERLKLYLKPAIITDEDKFNNIL